MPPNLEDRLRRFQDEARAVCAGLAGRITSRAVTIQAPDHGSTLLDLAFLRDDSSDHPVNGLETVFVNVRISAMVRDLDVGTSVAPWLVEIARERLYGSTMLAQEILSNTASTRPETELTDLKGGFVILSSVNIRVNIRHQIGVGDALGLHTLFDADPTSAENTGFGHAKDSTSARLITWTQQATQLAPFAAEIQYAGAVGGNTIDVLDASDAVVETLALPTTPTGLVNTSALVPGSYRARLIDAVSFSTLEITEKPTA